MYSFYLKLNKTKLWQRTKRFVYVTSVNKVNESIKLEHCILKTLCMGHWQKGVLPFKNKFHDHLF